MRLHYVSLLVAEAIIGNAKANSAPRDLTPRTTASVDSLTAETDDVPVLRFMRTTVIADEDMQHGEQFATLHKNNEERVASLDALLEPNAFKSTFKSTLKKLFPNDDPALIYHKKFKKWYEKTKDSKKALSTLMNYYGEDKLYTVLDARNVDSITKEATNHLQNVDSITKEATTLPQHVKSNIKIAKTLQKELLERWSAAQKPPYVVFKYMGLQSKLENILTNPNFIEWTKYLVEFNREHSNLRTNEINVLVEYYGEEAVVGMLQAANVVENTKKPAAYEIDDTKKLVSKLQEQLLQKWSDAHLDPVAVLEDVKLQRKLTDVLTSPYFSVWAKYLVKYSTAVKTSEIEVLLKSYDKKHVYELLQAAKQIEDKKDIAMEWQEQLMNYWLKIKYDPETALTTMENGRTQEEITANLREYLPVWVKYIDDLNKNYGGPEIKAFDVILATYESNRTRFEIIQSAKKNPATAELAMKWQEQLIQKWLEVGLDPLYVFKIVTGLPKVHDVLTSPYYTVWTKYLADYNTDLSRKINEVNKVNKVDEVNEINEINEANEVNEANKVNKVNNVNDVNEIEVLLKLYGEKDVFNMLETAKKVDATETRATNLQEQLMMRWVKNQYNADKLFEITGYGRKQRDSLFIWKKYLLVWSKYFDDSNGKSREDEMKAIIHVLQDNYNEPTVFKLFESVIKDLGTNDVAELWQEQLNLLGVKETKTIQSLRL